MKKCRAAMTTIVLLALASAPVWAQEEIVNIGITSEGLRQATESTSLLLADPILTELLAPEEDTFPGGEPPQAGDIAIGGRIEVRDSQKSGVLTPSYRISERFSVKATVPLIWQRRLAYTDGDAEASGIGDIAVDLAYDWPHELAEGRLRLDLQVKFPTGDSEKMDGDRLVPLGTGSLDYSFAALFARELGNWGFVGNAFLRRATVNEKVVELVDADDADLLSTTTYELSAGNQFGLAAHFRRALNDKWDAHLGTNLLFVGDGEAEYETRDNQGSPKVTGGYDIENGMKLVDGLVGVSMRLGFLRPYVGLRLPLLSSYSRGGDDPDRDLAIMLQIIYQPRMVSHG